MSEFPKRFLELSGEIIRGIGAKTSPKIEEYIQGRGDLEGLDISFIQVGYGFDPEPITPHSYITRSPYTNPANFKEQMDGSVERGWLEAGKKETYRLTPKAFEVVEEFIEFGNSLFESISGLSKAENLRLANLLGKLVLSAYDQPKPTVKPSLEIGRRLEPNPDVNPMIRIRRYLTDMGYFREDVHTASWQPYKVDGIVWETLTYIWRDEASNSVEITEKVGEYRNFNESDYAAVFEKLVSMGWASKEKDKYILTEEGKRIRQEAEDITDQLYAAAFVTLSQDEVEELTDLMERFVEIVRVPEAEETS